MDEINLDFLDQEYKPVEPTKLDRPYAWSRAVKREAMKLYMEGVPYSKIAKDIGVHRNTIMRWSFDQSWEFHKKRAEEKVVQIEGNKAQQIRAKHAKMAKVMQALGMNSLQKGEIKMTPTEIIKAMEFEQRIEIPESYNPNITSNTQINTIVTGDTFVKLLQQYKEKSEGK